MVKSKTTTRSKIKTKVGNKGKSKNQQVHKVHKFHKVLKIIGIVLGALVGLFILFTLGVFINHKIQTQKEAEILSQYDLGQIVEVDGKKVNYKIFNPEKTEKTLLLMPGLNVQNAALSFIPLASKIDARIILINPPGYALSDDYNNADVDYIVDFYRKTLKAIGIDQPVILMPHSISGLYATYWAEKYPDEIAGMVALDISSLEYYMENQPPPVFKVYNIGAKLGWHRIFILNEAARDQQARTLVKTGYYDDELAKAIKTLGMENAFPDFVTSEAALEKSNAEETIKIYGKNCQQLRKLFIFADPFEEKYYNAFFKDDIQRVANGDKTAAKDIIETYKKADHKRRIELQSDNVKFVTVPGPHTIWEYPTDELAKAINDFVNDKN